MRESLYQLQTSGYTLQRGALSATQVQVLRDALDRASEDDDQHWGKEHLEAIKQRGALRNLANLHSVFRDLLSNSDILGVIDALLQQTPILHSFDGLILYPGEGRFPWDFHTDLMPLRGVAWPANKTPGINTLILVDDLNDANGATWLIPASHHSLIIEPCAEAMAEIAIQVNGKAGDLLFFDARLWHCAGENKTTHPRRLIKMLFCENYLCPQMNYARAMEPGVLNTLDIRSQALLGVGIAPPDNVEELRTRLAEQL